MQGYMFMYYAFEKLPKKIYILFPGSNLFF